VVVVTGAAVSSEREGARLNPMIATTTAAAATIEA
jgi:hypothetical protein